MQVPKDEEDTRCCGSKTDGATGARESRPEKLDPWGEPGGVGAKQDGPCNPLAGQEWDLVVPGQVRLQIRAGLLALLQRRARKGESDKDWRILRQERR